MKKLLSLTFLSMFIMALIVSCGKDKPSPVPIEGYDTYTDAVMEFSIQYPKNWDIKRFPGDRVTIVSSKVANSRFKSFDPEGEPGAKIDFVTFTLKDQMTLDTVVAKKQFLPEVYSSPEKIMLDGVEAIKQKYQFPLADGLFEGEIYFATADGKVVSVITFETFADNFATYKNDFDKILKSVKLAKFPSATADTVKEIIELPLPSEKLVPTKGQGFTIQIPENFDSKNPSVGGTIKSYQYIGERRADCDIRVDIIDASKQKDLTKIVDQNKSRHKNAEPQSTSFAGLKAYVFNYTPIANVNSRVYYTLKGDKLYRVTMNWSNEEANAYKPIFEKVLNSFKMD